MIGKIELVRYKFPEGYREVELWMLHAKLPAKILLSFFCSSAEPKPAGARCPSVALSNKVTVNVLKTSEPLFKKGYHMNTTGKVLVGVLAGAAAGLLTGILIAPDSGKKTREKLLGKTKDWKNKTQETLDDAKRTYNKKMETFAGEGKSSIDYLKDTLKV